MSISVAVGNNKPYGLATSLSGNICVAFHQPATPGVRAAVGDTYKRVLVSVCMRARACVRACKRAYVRVPVLRPLLLFNISNMRI